MKLVSTLGWSAEVVLYPARLLKPDEMVVFYGPKDDPAIYEAKLKIAECIPSARFVEVQPFSMSDCIKKMRGHLSDDAVANITGGTKIMSFTLALLAAYREEGEIPVIYISTQGDDMKVHRIPLRIGNMKIDFKKNTTISMILKILLSSGSEEMKEWSGPEIREIMRKKYGKNISESTFNSAKEKLKKLNLIMEKKRGRTLYYAPYSSALFFVGGE
ncbi:MAG: hypothetical protein GXO25_00500 [Euryarchaeota archaeon]|nr:hypothetical protein [Euryarchaeota archaeon]